MIKTEAARSIFFLALCSLLIGAYAVADAPKQAIEHSSRGPRLRASVARQANRNRYESYRPEQVKRVEDGWCEGQPLAREALDILLKSTMLTLRTDSSGAILVTGPPSDNSPPTPTKSAPSGRQTTRPSTARPIEDDGVDTDEFPGGNRRNRHQATRVNSRRADVHYRADRRRTRSQGRPELRRLRAIGARTLFSGYSCRARTDSNSRCDATVGSTVVGYYLDETPIPDAERARPECRKRRLRSGADRHR